MLILATLAAVFVGVALFSIIPLAVGWFVGWMIRKYTGRPD